MHVITQVAEMQAYANEERRRGRRIGVVPTMGYLHDGHLSLVTRARELADTVVTTVFVNRMQFGPGEDFERYPRDLDRDCAVAEQARSDVLFVPRESEMIREGPRTIIEVEGVSDVLEGAFRPGHFRGVTTIVLKLLNITKPHVAIFGQKDAQQAFIVRRMVSDLHLDVEIVVSPTVREPDGLAMSSRNVYLNADERARAVALVRALRHAQVRVGEGMRSVEALRGELEAILVQSAPTRIDYIAFVNPETFDEYASDVGRPLLVALAVRYGGTRLIDNMVLS